MTNGFVTQQTSDTYRRAGSTIFLPQVEGGTCGRYAWALPVKKADAPSRRWIGRVRM